MVVLFTSAGMTLVGTWLVAYRQARQEARFVALSAVLLTPERGDT